MRIALIPLAATLTGALLAAHAGANADRGTRPYCGYSFAINLAGDEVIQFSGSDLRNGKTITYFAEVDAGEIKLVEHGPALPTAIKQQRMEVKDGVEILRLTKAGRFAGYRVRDARQGTDSLLTGSAFAGSTQDRKLLRRFDFGPLRQSSCAHIKV